MSKIISYNNLDCFSLEPVPVLASFDSQGHIIPLWVRIKGVAYKVDSAWCSHVNLRNIVNFKCKIIDGECLKPLSLTFYREEGMWTISKH